MKNNKIDKSIDIIEKEFNDAKNGLKYSDIKFDDKTKYNWKCNDCNEIWVTSNFQRRKAKKGDCSYCTNELVRKHESLGTLHPELVDEWSIENEKTIHDYKPKNRDIFKWNCKICNQEYEQRIYSRVKSSGCYCQMSNLNEIPHLAKELINADPAKIKKGSHKICEWKCKDCNHVWKKSVNQRVYGNSICPKCSKSEALEGNTLVDTHRHLMKEWDFEKNNISPFSITSKNSSIVIHWKCQKYPEHHAWPIKLASRISKKPTGCPYCNRGGKGKTSILESILTTHPDLAKEFNKEKNILDVKEVSAKSGQNIWWKCSNDGCEYEWEATPANRTSDKNSTGCRECSIKLNKKGQSKVEEGLRRELKKIFNSVKETPKPTVFKFKSGIPITVDFYIEEIELAFDLDPNHTHKDKPSASYNRDKEKTEVLKNYNQFFKLRQDPLTKISDKDIVYICKTENSKELAKLIYIKILELYPYIEKNIKSKLLNAINQ